MNREQESRDAWENSADGWLEAIDGVDVNREFLLDAVMLDHCGDVSGREALDIGCGEGRFCRMLAARGARTVGVEPTEGLRSAAMLRHPEGEYVDGFAERLPFVDNRFDLVVNYLVLIDVTDFRASIEEMARVLRPGGRAVVANLLPFATMGRWVRDDQRRPLHRTVDNYFEERCERYAWGRIEIVNWHRPLESYMQAFISSGLNLKEYREPCPTPDAVALHPSMSNETRVPLFHTMVWEKPIGEI
jgi:ubiquinone/menaquinone biosynthesis C-methylase UbiE